MLFSKRPTLVVTGEELCGQYNMTIIRKKELSTLKKTSMKNSLSLCRAKDLNDSTIRPALEVQPFKLVLI